MTTLTLELTDGQARQLAEEAERLGLPLQELAAQRLFTPWQSPEPEAENQGAEGARRLKFEAAMKYVFDKNAELYRRLA